MPTINQLPLLDQISAGDQLVVYAVSQGDARRISVTALAAFLQAQGAGSGSFGAQFATPVEGFSVTAVGSSGNIWVILQPSMGLNVGTVILPASPFDGQEVLVSCTQQVASLTVNGNGAVDVYGPPSAIAAETSFKMKYYLGSASWYRVA